MTSFIKKIPGFNYSASFFVGLTKFFYKTFKCYCGGGGNKVWDTLLPCILNLHRNAYNGLVSVLNVSFILLLLKFYVKNVWIVVMIMLILIPNVVVKATAVAKHIIVAKPRADRPMRPTRNSIFSQIITKHNRSTLIRWDSCVKPRGKICRRCYTNF